MKAYIDYILSDKNKTQMNASFFAKLLICFVIKLSKI